MLRKAAISLPTIQYTAAEKKISMKIACTSAGRLWAGSSRNFFSGSNLSPLGERSFQAHSESRGCELHPQGDQNHGAACNPEWHKEPRKPSATTVALQPPGRALAPGRARADSATLVSTPRTRPLRTK